MDGDAVLAIVGGLVVAFVIRVVNMLTVWLARILAVEPPDPIPPLSEAKHDKPL